MKIWVYLDGRQQGPFELKDLLDLEGMNVNTKVWFDGLPKWEPAGTLAELRPLFDGTLLQQEPHTPEAEEDVVVEIETPVEEEIIAIEESPAAENRPRYAPGAMYMRPKPGVPSPPSYIGWSIFLLLCCCSPVSLGALIASICVSTFYGKGQLDKARRASLWAQWLIMLSFALGILPMMLMSMLLG